MILDENIDRSGGVCTCAFMTEQSLVENRFALAFMMEARAFFIVKAGYFSSSVSITWATQARSFGVKARYLSMMPPSSAFRW